MPGRPQFAVVRRGYDPRGDNARYIDAMFLCTTHYFTTRLLSVTKEPVHDKH